MPQRPNTVNVIDGALTLGFSLSEAVQRALGNSLAWFATKYDHRPSEVSMCLSGYEGRVYPAIRDDLATELGVDRETVDRWIEDQRPKATGANDGAQKEAAA